MKTYSFPATIEKVEGIDGAFVQVPLDPPRVFGAGRIKVHATFDGVPYDGSVVAFKRDDGGRGYVLGIRKDIRAAIGKQPGESVDVTLVCTQVDGPAKRYVDLLAAKIECKGRSREELASVIEWLLGYAPEDLTDERLGAASLSGWLDDVPAYNPATSGRKGLRGRCGAGGGPRHAPGARVGQARRRAGKGASAREDPAIGAESLITPIPGAVPPMRLP